jgi:serine/threonine protein kinase
MGAVFTDVVIVQHLTGYIWAGLDSVLTDSHILKVARTFYALRCSLKKLDSYYKDLVALEHPSDSRYFPSITSYPSDNGLVEFSYLGYLENGADCTALHARTTLGGKDIVVKFVDRYGEGAHRLLAAAGLAPKLLYYGPLKFGGDDDAPSYQSISMVVMEYVEGETLAVAKGSMDEGMIEKVRSEIRRALELLHIRGLVFGDLRLPNVLITKDGEVKLIDFNWAGMAGQAKYPCTLSVGIAWAEGVKAMSVMKTEHDLAMLQKLF